MSIFNDPIYLSLLSDHNPHTIEDQKIVKDTHSVA